MKEIPLTIYETIIVYIYTYIVETRKKESIE